MEQLEFTIKSMPDFKFRTKKLRAEVVTAIASTLDLNDIERTIKTYDYILSNLEVDIKGSWVQVKQDKDYWPASLENDVIAVKELTEWFLENIIFKVFLKSRG